MSALPAQAHTLVVFRSGPVWLSAVVDSVEGVIAAPAELSPVPHADPCSPGIFEHRGETATVVDVACKLGLARDEGGEARLLLVRSGAGLLAFRVDELLDVAPGERFQWAAPPACVPPELFSATLSREGRLILQTDFEVLQRLGAPVDMDPWVAQLARLRPEGDGPSAPAGGEDARGPATRPAEGRSAASARGVQAEKTTGTEDPQPCRKAPAQVEPAPAVAPPSAMAEAGPGPEAERPAPKPPQTPAPKAPPGERLAPRSPRPARRAPAPSKRAFRPPTGPPPTLRDAIRPPPPRLAEVVGRLVPVSIAAEDARLPPEPFSPALGPLTRLEAPEPAWSDEPSWLQRPAAPARPRRVPRPSRRPAVAALLLAAVVALNVPLIHELEAQRSAPDGAGAASPVGARAPKRPDTPLQTDAPTPVRPPQPVSPDPGPTAPAPQASPGPAASEAGSGALPPWETDTASGAIGSLSPMEDPWWRAMPVGQTAGPYLPGRGPDLPPPFDPSALRVHVVDRGETLWTLADRLLRDPWRYRELARLSNIRDPDLILPGEYIYYRTLPGITPPEAADRR